MTTTERSVRRRPDYGDGIYVIEGDGGSSALGFDVCLARIDRYVNELQGRGVDVTLPPLVRGSIATYDTYKNVQRMLKTACDRDGEQAVAELSPQLIGLEGWRVEVVDKFDSKRRFIVGKSTGWLPCHLEIARRDSTGGGAADREYKTVKMIEKVR